MGGYGGRGMGEGWGRERERAWWKIGRMEGRAGERERRARGSTREHEGYIGKREMGGDCKGAGAGAGAGEGAGAGAVVVDLSHYSTPDPIPYTAPHSINQSSIVARKQKRATAHRNKNTHHTHIHAETNTHAQTDTDTRTHIRTHIRTHTARTHIP